MPEPDSAACRVRPRRGQSRHHALSRRHRRPGARCRPRPLFYLISKGGFAVGWTARPQRRSPSGNRATCGRAPWSGCIMTPPAGAAMADANIADRRGGDVLVPAEAVADLMAHGFVPVASRSRPPGRAGARDQRNRHLNPNNRMLLFAEALNDVGDRTKRSTSRPCGARSRQSTLRSPMPRSPMAGRRRSTQSARS